MDWIKWSVVWGFCLFSLAGSACLRQNTHELAMGLSRNVPLGPLMVEKFFISICLSHYL